jgi:hypothetical protein
MLVSIIGLLLIPATCANAAGPHSLFMDPMAMREHEMHDDHAAMTQDELEMHVLMGHMTPEDAADMELEMAATPSHPTTLHAIDPNPCELGGPSLRDLPSTMAMAAAMNPIVLDDDIAALRLPVPPSPAAAVEHAPRPHTVVPEAPPPQA